MEVRRLRPNEGAAKAIVDVVSRVKHLETRPSGTIYIDESLVARNPETGEEIMFGQLPDGSWGIDEYVNDTTPPGKPSTPTVTPVMGGLEIWWDGKESGGTNQPKDYLATECEYMEEGGGTWQIGGTFRDANGIILTNLVVGTKYFVRLISYDQNKNASEPSTTVSGVPVTFVDNEDVENALSDLREADRVNEVRSKEAQDAARAAEEKANQSEREALRAIGIADGKGRVIYSDYAPLLAADRNENNLWIDTSGTPPKNTPNRWNVSENKWVVVTDKKVDDAAATAGRAEAVANAAAATAAAAARAAGEAQESANGKNRVWYLPSPPEGSGHQVGDTWFDTSKGNMIHRWTGSEWVGAQDAFIAKADKKAADAAAAAEAAGSTATNAATAADNAAKAAGAKGKVIIQSAAPDAADRLPQNLWIDTTGGANTPKRWVSGTTWAVVTDKKATDAAELAVAAKSRADEAFGVAATAAETAGLAQKAANGKNRVWYSTTAPEGTSHQLNDIWYDEANGNRPMRWNGTNWVSAQDAAIAKADKKAADAATAAESAGTTATNAATAADNAAKAAGAKGKVIIQSTAPDAADRLPQNLWIDTTGGTNTPKRWVSGTTWTAVTDKVAQDAANAAVAAQSKANEAFLLAGSAAEAAGLAQQSADGKNKVWYSTTAPTGTLHRINDLWFDEANGNRPMRWDGAKWISTQDQVFKAIEQNVEKVTQSANGKNSIYYAATAPVSTTAKPLVVGDTWFDTANGNRVKVWSGSPAKWNDAVDALLTETAASVTEARRVADGKNSIYYETSAPVSTTAKPLVKGDTWFNTSKNYQMSTWTGGAWQLTQDSKAALDAANGKNKVSTGASAPASPTVGDTWIDTANGNVIKIYTATGWIAYQDKAIKEAKDAATGAQNSANGKNNNTYDLAAPTLAQGAPRTVGDTWFRIDSSGVVFGQWTWSGSKWDPVALRHEVIASIDAGKISTGTMDARFITANTITTDQMLVGFGTNLVPNPGFELGESPHIALNGATLSWYSGGSNSGTRSIISQNSTQTAGSFTNIFQVSSGVNATTSGLFRTFDIKQATDYVVSFYAKFSGTAIAGQRVRAAVYFYGVDGSYIGSRGSDKPLTLSWSWTQCEFILERTAIPAGTLSAGIVLQTDQPGAVQHDDWFFGEKINGSLLVKGSITADLGILGEAVVGTAQITDLGVTTAKIENLAVTDAKISTLNAGKINAGELDAARIGAKTITVDKLLVSSTDNLVQDADFSDPKGLAWSGAYSNPNINWDATGGRNGGPAVKYTVVSGQQGRYGVTDLPATGGSSYRILAWVKSSVAIPIGGVAIYYRQKHLEATTYYSPNISNDKVLAANVWHPISGVVTLKADATSVCFGVYVQTAMSTGTVWVDYLSATRASDGELIVDGAITSKSITTDGIDAGVIKFGSMDGGLIKADTIRSASLAVTDLTNFAPGLAGSGVAEWSLSAGMEIIASTSTEDGKRFNASAPTGTALALGPMKEVKTGDRLYASASMYRSGVMSAFLRWYFYNKDRTYISYVGSAEAAATATSFTSTALVPANAAFARIQLQLTGAGNGGFFDVRGYKQAPSTLIENGAITTDHMTVGTIDAKVIKFNTITGSMIQAKTISTDNLLITSTDNLIQEADFGAKGLGWDDLTTTAIVAGLGRNGGPALRFSASTTTQTVYNKYTAAVEAGASYRMFAWIKPSAALAAGHFALMAVPSPGTAIAISNKAIAANTWGKVEGMIKVAEGVNTIRFAVRVGSGYSAGTLDVDFVSVARAADGTLIVDGSITTDSMVAGTIDAKVLTARSIKGTQIEAKTITADNMLIGSTDNFIHEPDFTSKGGSWPTTSTNVNMTTSGGRNGGPTLVMTNTTGTLSLYNQPIDYPMEGGQWIRLSAWVKTSVAAPANSVNVKLRARSTSGTVTYHGITHAAFAANTWTRIQGMVELPLSTVSVSFYIESTSALVSGTTTWDYVSATRAAGGELIVDGSITSQSIVSEGIDAGVITAGTMSGARISAGTLSAETLIIGQGTNLLVDPNFQNDVINVARASRSTGTWTYAVDSATKLMTARTVTATTNNAYYFGVHSRSAANAAKFIPVLPGERYLLDAKTYTNISAAVRWNVETIAADGTTSYLGLDASKTTGTGWRNTEPYEYVVPAGVVAVQFALACLTTGATWLIDSGAMVARKTDGNLIVDGALTGKTITGALIETVATASRGIKMNATEFVAYNNSGVETLRLSGNVATITGATVQTATTGARVVMDKTGLRAYGANNAAYLTANASGLTLTGELTALTTSNTEIPAGVTMRSILGNHTTSNGINIVQSSVPGLAWTAGHLDSTTRSPASVTSTTGDDVVITARSDSRYQTTPARIVVGGESSDRTIFWGDVRVDGTLTTNGRAANHAEWSRTGVSVPFATNVGPRIPTLDTPNSSPVWSLSNGISEPYAFAKWSANDTLSFTGQGPYIVDVKAAITNGAVPDNAWLVIEEDGFPAQISYLPAGESTVTVSGTFYWGAASSSQSVKIYFRHGKSTAVLVNWRIKVTRVA